MIELIGIIAFWFQKSLRVCSVVDMLLCTEISRSKPACHLLESNANLVKIRWRRTGRLVCIMRFYELHSGNKIWSPKFTF